MAEKTTKFQAPRGTHDVLPSEVGRWRWVEEKFRHLARLYRYGEIRTPLFEASPVIHRTSGEASDIVSKETYDFEDRGGDPLTLRAEGTAPVVRAAIEHNLLNENPVVKLAYIAPMFRYDRPQKGRFRQHHQVGIEALGADDPATDAEVIAFSNHLLQDLGIAGATLKINSVGSPADRPRYRAALVEYFTPHVDALSEDSRKRLETNPLRILDSKDANDRKLVADAPTIFEYMDSENKEHFITVQAHLDRLGIEYTVDPFLVRGLDYYTRTAFEWVHGGLGAQSSIGGGGRYNGLVEALGGPATPGIGWGMGIERLLIAIEDSGTHPTGEARMDLYVAAATEAARHDVFALTQEARAAGLSSDCDLLNRSLKSQMKAAGKSEARYVVLIGDDEVRDGTVTLRDMEDKSQRHLPRENAARNLAELLGA